jgi:hypothetical protein
MARHRFLHAVLAGTGRYQPVPTADALIYAVLAGTVLAAHGSWLALHTTPIRWFLRAVVAGTGHY